MQFVVHTLQIPEVNAQKFLVGFKSFSSHCWSQIIVVVVSSLLSSLYLHYIIKTHINGQ